MEKIILQGKKKRPKNPKTSLGALGVDKLITDIPVLLISMIKNNAGTKPTYVGKTLKPVIQRPSMDEIFSHSLITSHHILVLCLLWHF